MLILYININKLVIIKNDRHYTYRAINILYNTLYYYTVVTSCRKKLR